MSDSRTFTVKLHNQSRHQIYALVAMFLLGMGVNVIGLPSEVSGITQAVAGILTGLHMLIGVGLVIGAILIVRYGYKAGTNLRTLAWTGLTSIGFAFASGITLMATENDWWSFAMSVGFIAAFLTYGRVVLRTK